MNRSRFYITIIIIAVFSLISALLIFPNIKTLTLMRYFNLEFTPSYQTYEKLYEEGDKTLSVINPLVKLNLDFANYNRAIELLEGFVNQNPDRVDILKWLSEIYLGSDMPNSYLDTLERIYKLEPSSHTARVLIEYYGFYGNTPKWVEWLTRVTTDFKGNPDEYEYLANYYASQGELEKALTFAKQSVEACDLLEKCGAGGVLAVSILLHQNKNEEAFNFSRQFLNLKSGSFFTADIVILFVKAQDPQRGIQLLKTLSEEEKLKAENISATIYAYSATKDDQMIYGYLNHLVTIHKLPPIEFNTWATLALTEEKDSNKFLQTLKSSDLSYLSDGTWMLLLEKAYVEKNGPLLDLISQRIPEEKLLLNPVLLYALEMARHSPPNPESLSFYLRPDQLTLTDEESAELAIVYHIYDLKALEKDELLRLPSFEAVPYPLINRLSTQYIDLGIAEDGYNKLVLLRDQLEDPPEALNISWIMLSTATGRINPVMNYLNVYSHNFTDTGLVQIYDAGALAKASEIQLKAAEILIERNPSFENQTLLANAWIAEGETAKGIELLKRLYREEPNNPKVETGLLLGLAKIHNESSFDRNLFNEVMRRLLSNKDLSKNDLRNLAYALADEGLLDDASQLFFLLAQSAELNSEDMNMLLYLWSDKLSREQAEWLASIAAMSEGKEKGQILSLLATGGYPDLVIPLVSKNELNEEEIFTAYILALATLHRNEEIDSLLAEWLPQQGDIERLKNLGQILSGNALYEAAEPVYLKVFELAPSDKEALKELGNLYFNLGAYSVSYYYLSYYICLYEADPLSLFHYAEIYNRDGDRFHSRPFYWAAINKILNTNREEEKKSEYDTILAISYFRLNYPFTGIRLLSEALCKPDLDRDVELSLRGSLANLLLDFDCLESVEPLLFAATDPLKKENKEALLYLDNLKTEWFRKSNDPVSAYAQSDYVLTRYNNEAYAWSSRAGLEDYYNHEWRAFMDYDIAIELQPKNEDFWRGRKDIIDRHRSFNGANVEYRTVGLTQKDHIYRWMAAYNPTLFTRYFLLAEYDRFDISSYVNAKTGLIDSAKGNRFKNTFSWIQDTYSGDIVDAEIYYEPQILGAGTHYTHPDLFGKTLVGIEFKRPNWDFAETIVQYGSRDRLLFERYHHLWTRLEGTFRIEGRRYHLHPDGTVADSIAWYGDISYTLPEYHWLTIVLGKDSTIVSSYNIDAEYGTWGKYVTTEDGNRFQPLNVGAREIHTVEMNFEKKSYRYFDARCNIGFAYDRFGGVNKASVVYGGAFSWDKRPGLTGELSYSHSPSTSTTNAEEDRLIFNLIYYY